MTLLLISKTPSYASSDLTVNHTNNITKTRKLSIKHQATRITLTFTFALVSLQSGSRVEPQKLFTVLSNRRHGNCVSGFTVNLAQINWYLVCFSFVFKDETRKNYDVKKKTRSGLIQFGRLFLKCEIIPLTHIAWDKLRVGAFLFDKNDSLTSMCGFDTTLASFLNLIFVTNWQTIEACTLNANAIISSGYWDTKEILL